MINFLGGVVVLRKLSAGLAVLALVAACAVDNSPDSSPDQIAAVAYRSAEPPSVTVFSMINNRTGRGGHTALMVNGSQRVIFDPAGSFRDKRVTERGDVLYGITPGWANAYKSAHARVTHHVVSQTIPVSAEQAELALRLVMSNGPVVGGFCAQSTTAILAQLDGFESIERTFFPEKLMQRIAALPNVVTDKHYENDDGDVVDAVRAAELAQ